MTYLRHLLLFLFGLTLFNSAQAQAIKVELAKKDGHDILVRGGEPYYVKGAGGHTQIDVLVEMGGNSIRTWSAADARKVLDEAHEKGLTVMVGLWVGHERHGFDYNNVEAISKQLVHFTTIVNELKDHPAILFWGIGNEVDLFYTNTQVWDAIQDIAAMIHRVDPNHPTSTVTAGLDSLEVALIKEKAPDIDIYCVNTYGDIGNVPENIRKFGWDGPYMITEWGPNGHWEVAKTPWGAPLEQTSEEKAVSYDNRYKDYIEKYKDKGSLGSYVFLWGQKQETTETWYGLFDAQGRPTRALDQLQRNWKGSLPKNQAPIVKSLTLNGSDAKGGDKLVFIADQKIEAQVIAEDPNGDKLDFEWAILPEATNTGSGGDAEEALQSIPGKLKRASGNTAVVIVPEKEGGYRLFVKVVDPDGKIGYANIPFYSYPADPNGEQREWVKWKKQEMSNN
jgi:hypothetical protein